jgi:DNA modification methylase
VILDPIAGSNTTGFCCRDDGSEVGIIEVMEEYGQQAQLRFEAEEIPIKIKS